VVALCCAHYGKQIVHMAEYYGIQWIGLAFLLLFSYFIEESRLIGLYADKESAMGILPISK